MKTIKLLIENGFFFNWHTSKNSWDKNETFIEYEVELAKEDETITHKFKSYESIDTELRNLQK